MQRNNRFINRANAEKHEAPIEKLFKHQIQDSIEASKIYSADSFSDDSEINAEEKADQLVWSCTSDIRQQLRLSRITRERESRCLILLHIKIRVAAI